MNAQNKLPTSQEEQIINMAESGRFNRNWLERVAYEIGMDFDADIPDQFNRVNNN